MAMLELMQQQINFLIINASKPQKRSQWESPPEFKVTPDRSRDRERTMAMVRLLLSGWYEWLK